MLSIITQFQVEGIHRFGQAPAEVEFLRHAHRHVFHFRVVIEVSHNDRELEFIMVKNRLQEVMQEAIDGSLSGLSVPWDVADRIGSERFSCEDLAVVLKEYIHTRLPKMVVSDEGKSERVQTRRLVIEVMEDNENGAQLTHGRE